MDKNAVGLILAAGLSSRMGAFKPLLKIGDMTAAERIAETYRKAGIGRIFGVSGYMREQLEPVFTAAGIREAYNPDYEQGMFTSIRAGIRKAQEFGEVAAEKPEGFFLMLVDCPLVPPQVIQRIWDKHREAPNAFIVPCFRGKKGHPLFIPAEYAEEILTYDGDGGLKAVTSRHDDRMIRLETGIEAVVLDMDTSEGYEEVLKYWHRHGDGADSQEMRAEENEGSTPDWSARLAGRRIILIRHGEIRQHKEKIFLGQTDVPLSDRGRKQAAAAAEELIREDAATDRIYVSDLTRTLETAEIIREHLQKSPGINLRSGNHGTRGADSAHNAFRIEPAPRLREMSLGEWDGRYISEIRTQYPEEYRKRGEDLLRYKYGNDSENYYDLQYRVMKGFEDILRQERDNGDAGRDLVIVTHSGVIAVLRSNLLGTRLEDEINGRIPNGGLSIMDFTKEKEIQV